MESMRQQKDSLPGGPVNALGGVKLRYEEECCAGLSKFWIPGVRSLDAITFQRSYWRLQLYEQPQMAPRITMGSCMDWIISESATAMAEQAHGPATCCLSLIKLNQCCRTRSHVDIGQ